VALLNDARSGPGGITMQGNLDGVQCSMFTQPRAGGGINDVALIAGGGLHTIAVKSDGTVTVWAWGDNSTGQLGVNPSGTSSSLTPVGVTGLTGVATVAAGSDHSVRCRVGRVGLDLGQNIAGQLGNGNTGSYEYTPSRLLFLLIVRPISLSRTS